MITALQIIKSLDVRASASRWILPALLTALGILYGFQSRLILKNIPNDSKTATAADGLQVRANGISMAVMAYLQNHDSDSLGHIEIEGKEASRLMDRLRQDAGRQGTTTFWTSVFKSYEEMRQATLTLLAADHEETRSRQGLNAAGESLMAIMMARMEPSIRPNQLSSSSRLQSVLAAAAEARSITKNTGDIDMAVASQRRFHRAVQKYAELSRTARAGHWAEEAVSLFDQCVSQVQELERTAEHKQTALSRYNQKKNVFDIVIQESHAFRIPGYSLKQIFSLETISVALGVFLLVIGLIVALRRSEAAPMSRVQNILKCVEAAATGDVTRLPEVGYSDDVGLLSRAVGRLIMVLARSENLVYHLAALVESSGDSIISHTLDGTVLSWNKGAQRMYGYSADEMKGQSISRLAAESGKADIDRYLQKLRNGERVLPFETTHCAKNGRSVTSLVRASAIYDSTRKIIGASFSAQEMTDAAPAAPAASFSENDTI